jgi:hypothetical protein
LRVLQASILTHKNSYLEKTVKHLNQAE